MQQQMRAVVIEAYGGNEVVRHSTVDRPRLSEDAALVRVHAAGVNPLDWKIRAGAGQRLGMQLPIVLGAEVAGTVVEVGREVQTLTVGDLVSGVTMVGGFAEYVAAKATNWARKPTRLGHIEAAAVPLGALTSWQALFEVARLKKGQKVLITSCSGGVGSLAVQLAKSQGAHVTGVASSRSAEFVHRLGADRVIDYEKQALDKVVKDMDVVFDTVGGDAFVRGLSTLRRGGTLVTAVAFPKNEGEPRGVRVQRVSCRSDGAQLAAIAGLIDAGTVQPYVTTVLPLADVARGLELSEAGRTRGKIVVEIGQP